MVKDKKLDVSWSIYPIIQELVANSFKRYS